MGREARRRNHGQDKTLKEVHDEHVKHDKRYQIVGFGAFLLAHPRVGWCYFTFVAWWLDYLTVRVARDMWRVYRKHFAAWRADRLWFIQVTFYE